MSKGSKSSAAGLRSEFDSISAGFDGAPKMYRRVDGFEPYVPDRAELQGELNRLLYRESLNILVRDQSLAARRVSQPKSSDSPLARALGRMHSRAAKAIPLSINGASPKFPLSTAHPSRLARVSFAKRFARMCSGAFCVQKLFPRNLRVLQPQCRGPK